MSKIQNNKTTLWIIILLVVIGALVWWNLSQRSELNEIVEQMTIEKEELQEEYEDLAIQFDGYQQMDIRNDSLRTCSAVSNNVYKTCSKSCVRPKRPMRVVSLNSRKS